MTNDRDATRIVRTWLQEGVVTLPDRVLDDVLGRLPATSQRQPWWLAWRSAHMNNVAKLTITAAALVLVAVAGIYLLASSHGVGGVKSTPSPPTPDSQRAGVIGLPPAGTRPSNPAPGQVVLQFDSTSTPLTTMWVYADGRLISTRFHHTLPGAGKAYIGLVEQRLTPSGVEFLRSRIISTGLFENDLTLAMEGNAPFLSIKVRNGDRLVTATWAWRGITLDAPVATPEQANTLRALKTLLADQSLWPRTAWEHQDMKAYVPSLYSVCFGVRPRDAEPGIWSGPIEPARLLALLPESAQDLLRAGGHTSERSMHSNGGCSRVTTENARALAMILDAAGIQRAKPEPGAFWLAYSLEDPSGSWDPIWIQFGPVLPQGDATWLGPG